MTAYAYCDARGGDPHNAPCASTATTTVTARIQRSQLDPILTAKPPLSKPSTAAALLSVRRNKQHGLTGRLHRWCAEEAPVVGSALSRAPFKPKPKSSALVGLRNNYPRTRDNGVESRVRQSREHHATRAQRGRCSATPSPSLCLHGTPCPARAPQSGRVVQTSKAYVAISSQQPIVLKPRLPSAENTAETTRSRQ